MFNTPFSFLAYPEGGTGEPGPTPSFNPDSISDLWGWWKSDAGIVISGGYVTTWTDQKNSNVATANTNIFTNTGTQNEYLGVELSTLADNRFDLSSTLSTVDFTVFSVLKNLNAEITYITGGNSGQGLGGYLYPPYGTQGAFIYQNPLLLGGGPNNTTTAQYVTWVKSSSSSFVNQNGITEASGGGNSNSFTFNKIFAGNGNISGPAIIWEILIYSRSLTGEEIGEVETYLASKYSI